MCTRGLCFQLLGHVLLTCLILEIIVKSSPRSALIIFIFPDFFGLKCNFRASVWQAFIKEELKDLLRSGGRFFIDEKKKFDESYRWFKLANFNGSDFFKHDNVVGDEVSPKSLVHQLVSDYQKEFVSIKDFFEKNNNLWTHELFSCSSWKMRTNIEILLK